jgi:CheY-like chemotaxis protein/two-component sensor histidine kinase
MAKIEADKLELTSVEYDFEHMLQKVINIISFRADEKRQKLTMKMSGDVPRFVVGDDQRLAQVITNLLSNAVKFTPEKGEIGIDISLTGEADGVCELRVEISDNGIGISPEQQEKLFSAFVQAESGTSRKYGGTGLGLVISKNIIELMGGKIWIESELGKGARVIFTIKAERLAATGTIVDADNGLAVAAGEFKGKTMLLAEDVEINREILISLLENTGLNSACAENGKEALDMVEATPDKYDMVFMDIQMPEMDGLDATRRIRALPGHQREKLPIIAMTANIFKEDIEACQAAGMDGHIGKPIDIDKVLEALRTYLV